MKDRQVNELEGCYRNPVSEAGCLRDRYVRPVFGHSGRRWFSDKESLRSLV